MRLKDITIGARLTLGFGTIIFLVVILGIISYNQAARLWQSEDDLYNHPLIVGRATRDIESNILMIHILMKDIALDERLSLDQIRATANSIDSYEKKVYKLFDVVFAQYLGSVSTIDSAYSYFASWKGIRDELISLRLNKGYSESYDRFVTLNKAFVGRMIAEIEKMIDFSNDKALSFYSDAEKEKSRLNSRLTIMILLIFISALSILYLLIKIIKSPLRDLEKVANKYSLGEYDARSVYDSKNEIGTLAAAFNRMASTVQNDIVIRENVSGSAMIMMNENELKPFCKGLLHALLNKTESQIAAIYLLNSNVHKFEHYESIGLSSERIRDFSVLTSEGEFGKLLTEKKIMRLTDIPEDTSFIFPSVAGIFKPREIITIPVIDNNEVIAIISLASIKSYSELSLRLLNDIQITINARLLGVINYQKIKDFSELLDTQNRELDQKSRELLMQSDELKEYNIELEQQKKQLDESNKLKTAFLSNMSHELRTPLNSVIALSGVLTRRLKGKLPEDEFNYLGIIERNGKNLLSLINDILDLSRIESGREEISISRFAVSDLISDITCSLEPITTGKGIFLSCQTPDELPFIISDRNKCHHILQNIISNAIKFTEEGSVEIKTWSDSDNLYISVADSGIGIPDSFLPFIFDEFRQADDKASRKFGGTGLGLAIVKKYCQLLNGSIDVKSKQGEGSVFTLTLPISLSGSSNNHDYTELHIETGNNMKQDDVVVSSGKGRTLLLVEDSEPQIIQLTDILREEGFTVKVARNGREALESISLSIPDAMVLDLQMPEVDGFEVLRTIRDLEATRSIPVLILTAKHITKSELSFLKENNIYQLIQKGSVNRNDLLGFVNNLFKPKLKNHEEKPAAGKRHSKSAIRASVLVIEDNPDNLITVKALLDDKYLISSAIDGSDGLEKALSDKPDLILLDISLPGKDGFKVLDEIRKNDSLAEIPVIALTARAMKGDREDLLAYGFNGYISKPIDNETFEKTIIEYLKK